MLAKLAANPLAELSPMETLINEGIVMPLRPIVNDRLEFNGGTIADRVVMPDQATVLDIQDLSTAKDGYRFRVFVEVTWQDLQDPAFLTGQSVTTGASTALQIVTARETEVEDTLKAQTLTVAASETIEVGDEIVLAGNLRAVVAAVTPEAGQKKVKVVLPTAGEFAAGTVTRESRDGTVTHDIAVSPVTSPAAIGALPYDVFVALRSYGLQGALAQAVLCRSGLHARNEWQHGCRGSRHGLECGSSADHPCGPDIRGQGRHGARWIASGSRDQWRNADQRDRRHRRRDRGRASAG